MSRPTIPKYAETFNFYQVLPLDWRQWIQTKTNVVQWCLLMIPIKLNKKNM